MWNGVFSPVVRKSAALEGSHSSNPLILVSEPEYGAVEITVYFNHACDWPDGVHIEPPSNAIGYTFDYELDSYVEGEDDAAADLQLELDNLHEQGKSMEWLRNNLESGKVSRKTSVEINGRTIWV